MKTKVLIALVAIFTLLGKTLEAKPVFAKFPLEKTEITIGAVSKTLIVKVTTLQTEDVYVSIENTEGVSFHSETVAVSSELVKRFNLKNLPMGAYNLVIKKKRAKTIQPFVIGTENIAVYSEKRELLPLPAVTIDGNTLKINVPTKTSTNFSIKIYDNLGTTFFEETYTELGYRLFDISSLQSGAYIVEVDGETYPITVK